MKKTLIALAALAATGATLAQSSVTIYGRMDLGMSSQDITVREGGTVTSDSDAFSLAGAQDERTGSRLGFRGTEDLGGGLRANFVYEIGINADREGVTNNARTRLANLSLTGGFGTVVVGTFMNAFDTVRTYSPATTGVAGGDFLLAHGTVDGLLEDIAGEVGVETPLGVMSLRGRSENSIAYVSPAFNGFTFSVGTLREESNTNVNVGAATSGSEASGFILGLGYAQGPLAAQFAFADVNVDTWSRTVAGVRSSNSNDMTNWAFAVRYDLGFVVPTFQYETSEITSSSVPGASVEFSAWEIGARFPMGAFAPYITFGDGEVDARMVGDAFKIDTRSWQIGTTYNLSTRTSVYAAVGEIRATSPGFRYERSGYSIGLVHTF